MTATKGIVVPAGGGTHLDMGAPGRVPALTAPYISVCVTDVNGHYERAHAAGVRIARGLATWWPDPQRWMASRYYVCEERSYEAFDLEGHRWRFHQRVPEVPQAQRRLPSEQ